MSMKRKLVRLVINWTDQWNEEVHQAFEEKVSSAYRRDFPNCNDSLEEKSKRMADMRAYYKSGMTATASLLLAAAAFLVASVALIVAVIQIFAS